MQRKLLSISLILVMGIMMAAILAGTVVAEDNLVFANITWDRQDVWTNYSVMAFEYAAEKKGVETIVYDPGGEMERQISAMEDAITKGVDGINVFQITPELSATLADMANAAGIPIVVENAVPAERADILGVVACEYEDIGYAAGKFISENYPGSKLFYAMGAPGMGITEHYEKGLHAALEKYNSVELVDTQPTDWGAEEAMNVTQNFLQSGKEADVIFANNEQMATGVVNALEEAGLFGEIDIIATGGGPHGLELIEDGKLDATMSAPVSLQGLLTFRNLWQYVEHGIQPPEFTPVPVIPVTQETIDEAISWEADEDAIEYIGGLDPSQ